ncbi:MAG: DNA polymerase [Methanobacterium sp. PtaU1.Bin242]|nr:MAG: DNA polymerase [Methanobacterium sp. PtaU1.Bin242]
MKPMESKKFVLLDIDYITENDEAVVRLFGRLIGEDSNQSIIALDKSFKPYIYVHPHDVEECITDLRELKVLKIEKVRKKDIGVIKEFLKVTLKHPQDVPKLREKIWNLSSVKEVREHDIPFYRRYLIDKGLFPMSEVLVHGEVVHSSSSSVNETCLFKIDGPPEPLESGLPELKVLSFDIEACNPKGMPQEKKDPIIMISFSSNHGFRKVFSTKSSSFDFVEVVEDEEELLKKFVETIKSENPDLITGYNSDVFDFPYIRDRAAQLGVSLDLGVDGSQIKFMRRGFANAAVIKGRIHVDLYPSMRRYLQLDRYTLERVYLELMGEDKKDIPGDEIHSCWVDDGDKLEELFEYSLDDAVAVTKIGENMLPLSMELTRIVGQPLFDVSRMATGQQVEWYLIRKAYEYGDIVPNKPSNSKISGRKRIAGGYVKDPVKGLHENIVYFDFRSLYPSIIISKNVSPDTITDDCGEDDCYIAPEVGYKFKKEPVGFVPSVIGNILRERVKIKKMMTESTDPHQKHILNVQQEALKRLANSMYGVYGFIRFRWYRIECADSITAWGRDFIKKTMDKAREFGFEPIYADTDGFYATYKP